LLHYASLHGYTPTDEDIKLVLPFADGYMEPAQKRQRVDPFEREVTFKEKYKEKIAEIERKTAKQIQQSIEKLNRCADDPGGCTVSGGKNKKLRYGSRKKTRRTRTKSPCFRN
jgi:hypothetical protein